MVKRSRRFSSVSEKVDLEKNYSPLEAMELLKQVSTAKFDETVELHIRTNVDPRHADQMIRGVCSLPHGLGKTIRVVVFAGAEGGETKGGDAEDSKGLEEASPLTGSLDDTGLVDEPVFKRPPEPDEGRGGSAE